MEPLVSETKTIAAKMHLQDRPPAISFWEDGMGRALRRCCVVAAQLCDSNCSVCQRVCQSQRQLQLHTLSLAQVWLSTPPSQTLIMRLPDRSGTGKSGRVTVLLESGSSLSERLSLTCGRSSGGLRGIVNISDSHPIPGSIPDPLPNS